MSFKHIFLFLSFWMFIFSSCMPLSSSRTRSSPSKTLIAQKDNSIKKWQDKEVLTLENDGVWVDVFFEKSTDKHLVFTINVQNATDSNITINPFQFNYDYKLADTETDFSFYKKTATNPELQILEYDKEMAQLTAREKGATAGAIIGAVLLVGVSVASIAAGGEGLSFDDDSNSGNASRRAHLQNVNEDSRSFWEYMSLRRTTLPPNYYSSGLVHFPRTDKADVIRLNLVIADRVFYFTYNQTAFF